MKILAKRPPIAERLLMLSRTPKLPEVLLKPLMVMPPKEVAERFVETKMPIDVVRNLVGHVGGDKFLHHGHVLISNDKVAGVFDPEMPLHLALEGLEMNA